METSQRISSMVLCRSMPAAEMSANFWASTERVPRYGEGEDGVEAYLIGASHYGKPTLTYLKKCSRAKLPWKVCMTATINPVAAFRDTLAAGIGVRAASLNGLPAGDSKPCTGTTSVLFCSNLTTTSRK